MDRIGKLYLSPVIFIKRLQNMELLGYIRLRVVQVAYELKTKRKESAQFILIPVY